MSMRNTSWLAYLTNFFSCVFTRWAKERGQMNPMGCLMSNWVVDPPPNQRSLTLTSCNKSSSTDTICSATFWKARSFLCICVVATHSDTKTCVFRNRGCLWFSHHGNFPTHADWQHQQKVQGCSGDSRSKAFHTSSLRPYTPLAEGHMHCSNTQVA